MNDDHLVHWKAQPGKALCDRISPATSPAIPGELLVHERAEVTCPACREWLHS